MFIWIKGTPFPFFHAGKKVRREKKSCQRTESWNKIHLYSNQALLLDFTVFDKLLISKLWKHLSFSVTKAHHFTFCDAQSVPSTHFPQLSLATHAQPGSIHRFVAVPISSWIFHTCLPHFLRKTLHYVYYTLLKNVSGSPFLWRQNLIFWRRSLNLRPLNKVIKLIQYRSQEDNLWVEEI